MEKFKISDYLQNYNKENKKGDCIACGKMIAWGRMKLMQHKRSPCPNITAEEKSFFAKRPACELETENDHSVDFSVESGASTLTQASTSTQALTNEKKIKLDTALAKFCYRTGIPFKTVDSKAFHDFIALLDPQYEEALPSAKVIGGSLLTKEFKSVSEKLNATLLESDALTLISDGWTNQRSEHIVNFVIKAIGRPSIFFKSINTSGVSQTAENVAESICRVIEELGAEKFVGVVTDNAANMRAAWRLIELRYPHISAIGCTAHCLNLFIGDLLEPHKTVIVEAGKIIKYINNHHHARALFDDMRKTENEGCSLSLPVPTRWYSQYNSFKSLVESKYILQKMYDSHSTRLKTIGTAETSATVSRLVRQVAFWTKITAVMKLIEMPTNVIGKIEADDSPLSLVYHYFGKMFQHYASDKPSQSKLVNRWKFIKNEAMGVAYMLTPKYLFDSFYMSHEDKIDFMSSVEILMKKRNEEIAAQASLEMFQFVNEMVTLSDDRKALVGKMSATQYWNIFGVERYPSLFSLAKGVNALVCSSAAAERVWSYYGFIHTRLRNRLTTDKVDKLVFIYANCANYDADKTEYVLQSGFANFDNDFDDLE